MTSVLQESPSNVRAGNQDSPSFARKSPTFERKAGRRKKSSELEDSLQALLANTMTISDDCKDATKVAGRIRRRSKDAVASLETMAELAKELAGAAKVWQSLGSPQLDSHLLTDEALRAIFDDIDEDKSGTLEESELANAIRKANPDATDESIKQLMAHADTDGDGCITFEEYKNIMRM